MKQEAINKLVLRHEVELAPIRSENTRLRDHNAELEKRIAALEARPVRIVKRRKKRATKKRAAPKTSPAANAALSAQKGGE